MRSWTRKFDLHTRLNDAIERKTGTTFMRSVDPIRQSKDQVHKQGDPYFDPAPLAPKSPEYGPVLSRASQRASANRSRKSTILGAY